MAKKFLNQANPIKAAGSEIERPDLDMERSLGEQANERTFGKTNLPDLGRQITETLPLDAIRPDPAQPRKAIPSIVRRAARQDDITEWQAWHRIAEDLHGDTIDLTRLLKGEGDVNERDPLGIPLVDAFLDLVALASSIYRDKLTNAITVIQIGPNRYQIETGERRWQAHRLLAGALEDATYNKIPARVVDKANVWKQATENNARRPLNAIGLARQIALLLMDLYRGRDGISLLPYDQMVQEGESDRAFYAQVANGNIYRVPKGLSERVLQATGLKSWSQLSHYRALLDIPDDVWMQADEEDWPEFRIRENVKPPAPPKDTFTPVKVSSQDGGRFHTMQDENLTPGTPIPPRLPQGPGTKATGRTMLHYGTPVELVRTEGSQAIVYPVDANGIRGLQKRVPFGELSDVTFDPHAAREAIIGPDEEDHPPTISTLIKMDAGIIPHRQMPPSSLKIVVGQTYKHRTGSRLYEVVGIAGDNVSCYEVTLSGKRITRAPMSMKIENLMEITALEAEAQVAESEDTPLDVKPLPSWAKPGRMVRDISTDETGKVLDAHWNGVQRDWYLRISFLEMTGEVPLAMLEANDPVPVLPDWVQVDHLIRHKDSGKLCQVISAGFNVTEDAWMLHVDVYKEGIADAPLSEFEPYIEEAAPRERHPALHPANMNGVIVEEQHDLGSLVKMADTLKMLQLTSLIMALQVMSAQSLRTRLRQSSREQVQAWLDTLYRACMDVLQQMVQRVDVVYANAIQVLDDIEAEQGGQS